MECMPGGLPPQPAERATLDLTRGKMGLGVSFGLLRQGGAGRAVRGEAGPKN